MYHCDEYEPKHHFSHPLPWESFKTQLQVEGGDGILLIYNFNTVSGIISGELLNYLVAHISSMMMICTRLQNTPASFICISITRKDSEKMPSIVEEKLRWCRKKERKEKNQFPLKHIFQGVPRRTMKFRGCEKETKIFKKKDDYLCRNETRFSWKKNKKLIYRQRQWQKVNILRAKFVSLLLRRRYISSPSAVIIKQKWSLNSTTNVTCHAFIVTQQRRGAKKKCAHDLFVSSLNFFCIIST